ncbi:FRG domain-containing protein [Paenibacillus xylanexedens]|uniref:FRG domain-containing protein n=1 Tax=Paenibacillus xylanexedens TaxID=528191 RepID=UPI0011A88D17|nr:FRG domain-containing protein [Paenibacillus xylanexedens]
MIPYEQIVREVHIRSAKEMFEILSPFNDTYNLLNNKFIFRGVASTKHSLIPTALRVENFDYIKNFSKIRIEEEKDYNFEYYQRAFEYEMLYDFFVKSDNNGLKIPHVEAIRDSIGLFYKNTHIVRKEWLNKDFHELAALAQHYGLPTRLLDWSSDPFVSLYFASVNALKQNKDHDDHMVLWAFNRSQFEFKNIFNAFTKLEIINPPYGGNDNLRSQKGILTYWRGENLENLERGGHHIIKIDRRPLDELLHESLSENEAYLDSPFILFHKILIPNKEATNLFLALDKMNYNAARLFPGFDGIVLSMKDRLLAKE